jgi:hypothetical protein
MHTTEYSLHGTFRENYFQKNTALLLFIQESECGVRRLDESKPVKVAVNAYPSAMLSNTRDDIINMM